MPGNQPSHSHGCGTKLHALSYFTPAMTVRLLICSQRLHASALCGYANVVQEAHNDIGGALKLLDRAVHLYPTHTQALTGCEYACMQRQNRQSPCMSDWQAEENVILSRQQDCQREPREWHPSHHDEVSHPECVLFSRARESSFQPCALGRCNTFVGVC
jgi:hypothetical protein